MAYNKFLEFVSFQNGDINSLKVSDKTIEIKSDVKGTITKIDAKIIGEVSMKLGAGRITKDDTIDHTVGIVLNKVVGDIVNPGEVLCTLYVNKIEEEFNVRDAFEIIEII